MSTKNIKFFREMLLKGNDQENSDRSLKASETSGVLRGAMAGAIVKGEVWASKCGRLDQARLLGVERTVTFDERVMFSAGFGHELFLEGKLKLSCSEFVREVPVKATLKLNGRDVEWHGTPDFQIKVDGEWIGVEAKSLVSNFSVSKQIDNDSPFRRHILQSAHYMTVLGRKEWLIVIGHYFYAQVGKVKMDPSVRLYELRIEDGLFVCYSEDGKTIETGFGPENVMAYLEEIAKNTDEKKLMPIPKWFEFGGARGYDECGYCPAQNICSAYDSGKIDFASWLERLPKTKKQKKG